MFVAYGSSLNGFILGCQKMLLVDETHLRGLYEGMLMAAIALDADNHVFDITYAIVSGETKEVVVVLNYAARVFGRVKTYDNVLSE